MDREYKPIRTLILGDLSRYQFMREIIPASSWEEIWHRNRSVSLPQIYIEIEAQKSTKAPAFYIGEEIIKLEGFQPEGTSLIYPPEGKENSLELLFSDRIVFFDEFPFRERMLLEKIRKLSSRYPLHPMSVVLFHPERNYLQTDLTTVESAADEAREMYRKEDIRTEIHVPGSPPDFLYWKRAEVPKIRERQLQSYPEMVREKIEKHFHFELDLLLLDLNLLVDVNELERFIKFSPDFIGKNLFELYGERFRKAHLEEIGSDFMQSILACTRYFISPLCLWPEAVDAQELQKVLVSSWKEHQGHKKEVCFHGTDKMEYHEFLVETKAGLNFKTDVSHFINKEVPVLLKKYMEDTIKLYEEIIHES